MIDISSAKTFEMIKFWLDEIGRARSDTNFSFMVVGSHSAYSPTLSPFIIRPYLLLINFIYSVDKELHRECPRDTVEVFLRSYSASYVEYSAKFPAPNIHRILSIIINEIAATRRLRKVWQAPNFE